MRIAARRPALPALLAATALLLAGCASPAPEASVPDATAPGTATVEAADLLTPLELDGLDGRGVIDALETMPVAERPTNLIASVRGNELLLKDDAGREASMPLPEDEFYTSIAPYVNQTHECFFHSLTTCRGELSKTDVKVTIVDSDGAVVFDDTVTTADNGFAGFWLPRDIEATITVEYQGKSVTAPLATGAEDATCVTTLQLT